MKLLAVFSGSKLPRQNNFMFTSILKAALEVSAPDIKEEMYNYKNKSNKKPKSFTGSIFLQDYVIEENVIQMNGEIRLTISSPSAELLLYVYNGLIQKKIFKYQEYVVKVDYVKVLPEKLPTKGKVLFKTTSPIAMKNKDGYFLDIDDPNYNSELNYISNAIIQSLEERNLKKPIVFTPVMMKKKVVKLKHHAFKKINNDSILYVQAFDGTFLLEGDIKDLIILSQTGLGYRRSQFFGSIEMLQE